jgi:hypothetical protein
MGAAVTVLIALEDMGACCTCGTRFAAEAQFKRNRLDDHRPFYCPNGHSQSYVGETEAQRLAKELERERKRREQAEDLARRRGAECDQLVKTKAQTLGKLRAIKQRVKNGVCPCCNRSFVQLARHMATKHPDYAQPEPEETGVKP